MAILLPVNRNFTLILSLSPFASQTVNQRPEIWVLGKEKKNFCIHHVGEARRTELFEWDEWIHHRTRNDTDCALFALKRCSKKNTNQFVFVYCKHVLSAHARPESVFSFEGFLVRLLPTVCFCFVSWLQSPAFMSFMYHNRNCRVHSKSSRSGRFGRFPFYTRCVLWNEDNSLNHTTTWPLITMTMLPQHSQAGSTALQLFQ